MANASMHHRHLEFGRIRTPLLLAGAISFGAALLALALVLIPDYPNDARSVLESQPLTQPLTTANTTRIDGGDDPFSDAVAISQMIYPASRDQNKPGAVVLAPVDDFATAAAATHIAHFPVNAPILYTNRDSLPEVTRTEIERLDPEGVFMDGNTKVYVIGDVGDAVFDALHEMGMETRHIAGADPADPVQNAEAFDRWGSTLLNDHADVVVIANVDRPEFAMAAASWNAHAGDAFLYVTDDGIPDATRDALEDRDGEAFMFVFGGRDVVSQEIAIELADYGIVDRIPGETPAEVSVNFAGFRDAGTNFGWWLHNVKRDFGWGIAEGGHGFTLVNPSNWQPMVTATIFSHMGKHAPMLLLNEDGTIPAPVRDYLQLVQPGLNAPDASAFNHGWIVGGEADIPRDVQIELESLLRPSP